VWLTGLPSSGKSTLANAVETKLFNEGHRTYVLDGDNIRHGLCGDLSFSEQDRKENIRRIGEVSKLFLDAGVVVITAFISPYRADRELVRQLVGKENFVEIYVSCPLYVCEQRDVKGMYKKARNGEITQFTGVSSPYEVPLSPELEVYTDEETIEESVERIVRSLHVNHKI
jgi:adenylylsulfate kinase